MEPLNCQSCGYALIPGEGEFSWECPKCRSLYEAQKGEIVLIAEYPNGEES